jgi:signal transduction histidine kinase
MKHFCSVFALALSCLLAGSAAFASDYGSPEEAQAMLERAVAAMESDQDAALSAFVAGEADYKENDLYVYCGGPDGNFSAHPSLVGKSLKDLKDKAGNPLGEEIYANAKTGEIAEVSYMWPRPGEEEPVEKVAYVTMVGDQICAVGYYKQ